MTPKALWAAAAVAYAAALLGTSGLTRGLVGWLNVALGRELFRAAVSGLYVGGAAAVFWWLRRVNVRPTGWVFAAVTAAAACAALLQIESPEERVHFLEYVILVLLVERAWPAQKPIPRLLAAGLIGCAVGALDEVVQKFRPERVFDWRDIGFNAFGSALGVSLVAIARLLRSRPSPAGPVVG